MRFWGAMVLALALGLGPVVRADTVADVRADLERLSADMDRLRQQLVAEGAAGQIAPGTGLPALQRLDQLEAELRRLTGRVETLTNDIDRVVRDATNRIGDLEFRLTELEGGDLSLLGQTRPLGNGITPMARPGDAAAAGAGAGAGGAGEAPQLAIGEEAEFRAAREAHEAGEHARAVRLFDAFLANYPGGPLSAEAEYWRAAAHAASGDHAAAARGYLAAFSAEPEGRRAADALFGLGLALSEIGQTSEACLTLAEVGRRFPDSAARAEAEQAKVRINCQ